MKMSIGPLLCTFAAAALVAPVAAEASDIAGVAAPPTATVGYGDLNLVTASGQAALQRRIRNAAERLCTTRGVRPLGERIESRHCVATAIANANRQLAQAVAGQARVRLAADEVTAVSPGS